MNDMFNKNINEAQNETSDKLALAVETARRNRKKKKYLTALISSLSVALVCIFSFSLFYFLSDSFAYTPEAESLETGTNNNDVINIDFENEEMRGVWIASVININYPSKTGLSEKELKAELDSIVENAKEAGLNAVFFQVRPTADALYPSEIFPYSKYLTGTQGVAPENNFDSLEYLIKISKENGIDVHAWVNPYRVTMYESDEAELCGTHPAVIHPEYTVKYADKKTYFNPGLPEVRKLVVDGVKELAQNYPDLSGIHFDDYFYPYPSGDAEFDDDDAYKMYGAGLDKDDWRRENVNTLIRETYEAIKQINPDIRFGVSPFGIWANAGSDTYIKGSTSSGLEAYNDLYCDAVSWANDGYVDYLVPQIYWSFSSSSAPFDNMARWWNAALDGTNTDLYIGHAAYKVSDFPENEIGIQVEFARNLLCYKGSVYYGYSEIKNNTAGLKDKLKLLNSYPIRYQQAEEVSAKINQPGNNYNSTLPTVNLVGESDVKTPLTVNGDKLSRTKSGLFSYYDTISAGINVFTLMQGKESLTHNINYKTTREAASSVDAFDSMQISDVFPSSEAWLMAGDTLNISCVAPAGSKVSAKIGGIKLDLKPTKTYNGSVKYAKITYEGSVKPSTFVSEYETADLGTLIIEATLGNEKATARGALVTQMGKKALVYAEVVNDYSYRKIKTDSSFYDDYTPVNKGMRDYVRGLTDNYYLLQSGGYIHSSDVKIYKGIELNKNVIMSVKAQVNGTDTSNNKNNFTDVVFECLENVPVNAVCSSAKIEVTFSNTDTSVIPLPQINPNPLISSISAKASGDNTVCYTVNLKNELNAYGYDVLYENGNIILRMKNPQTLSDAQTGVLTGKTIVVDAGHGGADGGAPGCGKINEADLNLEIALHLQTKLESLGAKVLMTRTGDYTVSLEERIEFLNEANPDIAISVHQNSIATSSNAQKIRGYLGLYGSEAGKLLAKTVSGAVSYHLNRYERPYAYQKLAVARNHRFPSTLCEMCFVSNVEEYEWSITPGNTKRSADAIAEGVIDYYEAQAQYLTY